MTTHTHLLTLGTGPDREEVRLTEDDTCSTLTDEYGDTIAVSVCDDWAGTGWHFVLVESECWSAKHPQPWRIEAV